MKEFTERQIEIMEAATQRIDRYGIQNLTTKTLAADIGLSEPALYRHFDSKNDILSSLLTYFTFEMKERLNGITPVAEMGAGEELRAVFDSQLKAFVKKPAIVSVLFAESIFHYDEALSRQVAKIMEIMHKRVLSNVKRGRESGEYRKVMEDSTLTTIIMGGIRMTILKWKMVGHRSDLVKDGEAVLEGILTLIENNK